MEIGKKIREARIAKGLTQKEKRRSPSSFSILVCSFLLL